MSRCVVKFSPPISRGHATRLNIYLSSRVCPLDPSLVSRPSVGAEARMSFSSTGSGSVPPIVGGTGAVNQDVIMFGE